MMKQYEEIKKQYADCILLYRLGDFYEMFGEDAIRASKILNITLTARNKGDHKIPMCGVPYHAIEGYLAKLIKNGEKCAICEQMSDPNLPGIVERDVVKVITPGTTFNDNLLDTKTNNYIIAIVQDNDVFGLAYADITTGDFKAGEVKGINNLITEITKIAPVECIFNKEFSEAPCAQQLKNTYSNINFFTYENYYKNEKSLLEHFNLQSLDGFGFENKTSAVQSASMLFNYLKETQKNDLKHIQKLQYFSGDEYMPIDESTQRNLELLFTLKDQKREGALISIIDHTVTSAGGRMLKFWLTHPLINGNEINRRLEAVNEFFNDTVLLGNIRTELKEVMDIERIMAKLSIGTGGARDLTGLKLTLGKIPSIKKIIDRCSSEIIINSCKELKDLSELYELIDTGISEDAPMSVHEGEIIKDGYNNELDELKRISREGKNFIKDLQEKEIKRTGINSLKVRYNKVFSYYIEISKVNLKYVPEDYIRKQTLVNAERFITPELKEYEEKILTAQEKIIALEYDLFVKIRNEALKHIQDIQKNAWLIAAFDVLSGFAYCAKLNNYTKPVLNSGDRIEIIMGRHPVIEKMSAADTFIPNDVLLDNVDNRLLLITGPNMGGKSTILRQTALIVLLAHIGSFVPAKKCETGIVDRIFTRVGASDNLIRGQSTFMVEMQEAANILNNATNKSLIILDEIGRGTSTYDGVSIAWSLLEYIHNKIKAKTLFASHYHELIGVVENLAHAKNFCVSVKETNNGVIFLYKLETGGIDKSYGIEVARLAGLPAEVIENSKTILKELEAKIIQNPAKKISDEQMDLFNDYERKTQNLKLMKDELEKIDVNNITPLEAIKTLDELKRKSNSQ